jgi:hypothetical protein
MKNKLVFKILSILIMTSFLMSCSEEFNEIQSSNQKLKRLNKPLMDISYEITTSISYDIIAENLSDLDLSSVNPSNEKQKVTMKLLDNGQVNMTIEDLDFKQKIKISHKILPDTSSKITKTVIIGNSANFYNKSGDLLSSENIPIPNQMELVNKIKKLGNNFSEEDINETIATMQGQQFIENLDEFINNPSNNIQVLEQGNSFITIRMSLSDIDPRMTGTTVLLVDKNKSKLVGTRIYSEENKLLQSTLYGYNKGEIKSLNAIQVKQPFLLPSGKETTIITLSKIENLTFNLNI